MEGNARYGGQLMRVVAGIARGRRLVAPTGREVRPTTDRVRESLFNALGSLDAIDGARVLDLFAGSGALAIEALSRGAATAVLVEHDRSARQVIEQNLETTGFAAQASVTAADARIYLGSGVDPFDLVLLDPPYSYDDWAGLLADVAPLVAEGGLVVIESGEAVDVPAPWVIERAKRYGGTLVTFARPPSPSEPR
jgi:16S rRNA (guanine966-N2)-methyltransferase